MRWLKDKKREKRSGSVGYDEDDNDDDYGFEKEKSAQACSKSPTIKRQLPPTPLTPEEISPHIYEEIHDGQIINVSSAFPSGSHTGSRHRVKRVRHSSSATPGFSKSASTSSGLYVASSSTSSKYTGKGNDLTSSSKDDSISPYMVVPVDEEVRQTPTHFHRNGTPEVHCDVIVKDTHCEIFLSRKPKVTAFKPDPSTIGKENVSRNSTPDTNPAIRNNTHFCSRNRRASVDVHNFGSKSYSSSSGAWNSSALSSSSTSRVNSMGTSMMSLSTLSERERLPTLDDNASSGSSAKGILTYTVGGNIIPRTNKLTFNPLKPMDGDDSSLSNQDPFFSMMPPPQSDSSIYGDNPSVPKPTTLNSSARLSNKDGTMSPTLYSEMSPPLEMSTTNNVGNNTNSNNIYQPPTQPFFSPDLELLHSVKSPNDFFRDSVAAPPCSRNPNFPSIHGYNPNNNQEKPTNSNIRASSPSNASSCTYASVSFPTEPKIYNTIAPDLISQDTTRELQSHTVLRHLETSVEGESETESVRYSSIQDTAQFENPGVPNQSHQINLLSSNNMAPTKTSLEPFQFGAGVGANDSVYSGVLAYRIDNIPNTLHSNQPSGFPSGNSQLKQQISSRSDHARHSESNNANAALHSISNELYRQQHQNLNFSRGDESASGIIYSGIINQNEVSNKGKNNDSDSSTLYASIETSPGNDVDQSILRPNLNVLSSAKSTNPRVDNCNSLDTTEADVDRLYGEAAGLSNVTTNISASATAAAIANSILLDFCTCSDDQHSSDCGGFLDGKADDDTSSIATTINEHRGPCTGCGRLIRQITYSESYSDDTYEHVYSSRLLLRRGRRFSSPDITTSEMSNSETNKEFENVKSHRLVGTMSCDDSCMSTSRPEDVEMKFIKPTPITDSKMENVAVNNSSPTKKDVYQSKDGMIQTEHRNDAQIPLITHAKPRQSFSAFCSSTKTSGVLSDKIKNVHTLAHHRSSLPVIHPSNLVPFTEDITNSSTATSSTQLQPKPGPFSNFLSKLSRPKPKLHNNKISDADNVKSNQKPDDLATDTNLTNTCLSSQQTMQDTPIPEKNTTKLSKFFQLLSSSDGNEAKDESKGSKDKKRDDDFKINALHVEIPENSIAKTSKLLRSPSEPKSSESVTSHNKNYLSAFKGNFKLSPKNNDNSIVENICPKQSMINDQSTVIDVVNQSIESNPNRLDNSEILSSHANTNEALVDSIIIMNENKNLTGIGASSSNVEQSVNRNINNTEAASKGQNKTKTDSGDTCYEFDISTSSESEQTSYDYVLSKVKKSLNLEHEVQQIADMNAQRRKMFCKKCKKSDVCGSGLGIDNEDNESIGSDNGCPYFSAKFGDLRKIFGDFVVDQRAAILDCLTDYAHGPFSVKGDGRDNTCRGCGGEILTSDSESMTTVYSILSQQFRRTSPDAHTLSCDSDDGTMADNSCESADEEDNDVSSGYDEAIGPNCEQSQQQHYLSHKTKRKEKSRERKERRLHHFVSNSVASSGKDHEKLTKRRSSGQTFPSFKSDSHSCESNSSSKPYQGDGNSNNNGVCNENKYQSRHKQDTLHSTDKSFLSTHSSPSTTVQKNSLKKGGSNSKTEGQSVASDNTNTTNDKNPLKNSNNLTTNNSNQSKLVCNRPHKHTETGTGTNINISNSNNGNDDNTDSSISTKHKPRLLATEKVIQDIYAPLSSKALSWLTARCSNNYHNINTHDSILAAPSCCVTPHTPHQQYLSTKTTTHMSDNVKTPIRTTMTPSENLELFSDCSEVKPCIASCHGHISTSNNKDLITSNDNNTSNNNNIIDQNNTNGSDNSSVQTSCGISRDNNDNDSSGAVPKVVTVQDNSDRTLNMKEYSRHKRSDGGDFGDVSEFNKEEDKSQFNAGVGSIRPVESNLSEKERGCLVAKSDSSSVENSNASPIYYQKKFCFPIAETDSRNVGKVWRHSKNGEYGVYGATEKKQEMLTSRKVQKQLQMAALDLLPETVLGSDTDDMLTHFECNTEATVVVTKLKPTEVKTALGDKQTQQNKQQQQQKHHQPMKSKMVERLTKMFEENSKYNHNKTTPNSTHNTTIPKSENIGSCNINKTSITEATKATSSSLFENGITPTTYVGNSENGVVGGSVCHSDTTHGVIGFTSSTNSPGRSYIRAAPPTTHHTVSATTINNTADNDNATNAFSSPPSSSSLTTFNTTTTTQSPPTHGINTGSAAAIFVPPPFVKQQTQKIDSFSHPSPSPSFVKPSQLFPSSTALSNSTTPTSTTTNLDYKGKSPLYNCRSSSSSSLLLSSSSSHVKNTDNSNYSNKNSGFNTTTNTPTLETNSNRNVTPPKPPTPKKPNLFITTSNTIAQTAKPKSERSRKDQLKKGNNDIKSLDNDITDLCTKPSKTQKDLKINFTIANTKQKTNFESQEFQIELSRQTSAPSARKQIVSPSPSSSSGSSSKRIRSGNGGSSNGGSSLGVRQKKLSKRGHPHRRTRSKSERRHKSSHHHHLHHQERTRYYFSSDLSDIDVIEVENWETYNNTARAHPSPSNTTVTERESSSGKLDKVDRRKRGDKQGNHSSRFTEGESSVTEDSVDQSMIQEIYSIPPSSSEIREAAAAAAGNGGAFSSEGGNASSPQVVKKSKKTDTIYKSKKNNNKLLSDLIIRNYDRQMYDVGGGNNGVNTTLDSTA